MRIANDRGLILINVCKELYPTVEAEVVYVEGFSNMTYVIEPATTVAPTRLILNILSAESFKYLTVGLTKIIASELNISTKEVYVKVFNLYNARISEVRNKYIGYINGTKAFGNTISSSPLN